jgi:hypothetical protein
MIFIFDFTFKRPHPSVLLIYNHHEHQTQAVLEIPPFPSQRDAATRSREGLLKAPSSVSLHQLVVMDLRFAYHEQLLNLHLVSGIFSHKDFP